MSAQMYQVSVTFHDVAACFSAEEWGLLEDWQKEVYRNVMTEIHSAMQAMGFEIINPDVLFRIKKVKEAYTSLGDMDRIITSAACPTGDPDHLMGIKHERLSHIDMGMKKGNKMNPHPGCSPDILLRIKQEEQPAFTDPPERSATPSPVEPVVTSVFSLNINEEEEEGELHPADRPESKTTHPQKRLTSRPIKQEEVDYIKVSVGSHGSDRITTTSRERLTSRPIKQEEVDYIKVSVGSHGSDRITTTSRGPSRTTSQESMESTPPPPQSNDPGEESSEESCEEPVSSSPGHKVQSAVTLELQDIVEKPDLPKVDLKAETLGGDSTDTCHKTHEPHSMVPTQQLLLQTQDRHFSAVNVALRRQSSTLRRISSHQRESNILMEEQNSILSQIANSLSLLQIQQTNGLATLGNIIQKGIDVICPTSNVSTVLSEGSVRTMEHPNIHTGPRKPMGRFTRSSGEQAPIPQKRKII
ncbi:uncharacterized protein LOC142492556 isoform X3 [Ascaphus truei]|uniref:uncharacterized protein LOC142492556 isoform X3 n=1 Tax=Ascaphus truei TaxID=8439 RepID=UPI003F5AB7DF